MAEAAPPLALRRARLIALAASQRQRLAADVEPWRRPLSFADRGIAAARYIGKHPAWLMGTAIAPLALRNAGLGTWLRRGFTAWRVLRRLRA